MIQWAWCLSERVTSEYAHHGDVLGGGIVERERHHRLHIPARGHDVSRSEAPVPGSNPKKIDSKMELLERVTSYDWRTV